eukprot:gene13063-15430_t
MGEMHVRCDDAAPRTRGMQVINLVKKDMSIQRVDPSVVDNTPHAFRIAVEGDEVLMASKFAEDTERLVKAFERAAAAPSAVVHHDKILRREKKMRGAVNEEMITTAAEASHALQKAQLLLQSFVDASDEA